MATLKTQFGGLNSDLYPNRLPSGTADKILNCTIEGGDITKRGGFAKVEDDVNGSAGGVLNMFVAHFANGDVYLVCKVAAVLYHRKMYPTDAGSFSSITSYTTHNSTDKGWFYMYADRLHFFDNGGGSSWNPDVNSGVAYKAGICRPPVKSEIFAATPGTKLGNYHVHATYRNNATKAEGVVSLPQSIPSNVSSSYPLETMPPTTGGIDVKNWKTGDSKYPSGTFSADETVRDNTIASKYEWDEVVFYCTFGNTEVVKGGQAYSYRAYRDEIVAKIQPEAHLEKGDHILRKSKAFDNSGGIPPASQFGCYDGTTAVYGGVLSSDVYLVCGKDVSAWDVEDAVVDNDTGGKWSGTVKQVSVGHNTVIRVQLVAGKTTADITLADGINNTTASDTTTLSAKQGGFEKNKVYFSKPTFPTMVPQEEYYSLVVPNSKIENEWILPRPWTGELVPGIGGASHALASGGGRIILLSATATYILIRGDNGKLWPKLLLPAIGCIGSGGVIGTPASVQFIGHDSWIVINSEGWRDLAKLRVADTIGEIPNAYKDLTVAGYYSAKNQIWMAMGRPNSTKAQRILIYDMAEDVFTVFEPACLGTRAAYSTNDGGATNNDLTFTAEIPGEAGNSVTITLAAGGTAGIETVSVSGTAITVTIGDGVSTGQQVMDAFNDCMEAVELATCTLKSGNDGTGVLVAATVQSLSGGTGVKGITGISELALPNADTVMLISTDGGAIYKYPSGTNDNGEEFAVIWRGYFGQERSQYSHRLSAVDVHAGANVSGNVRMSARSMRTGGETVTNYTKTINKSNEVEGSGVEFSIVDGNLFQIGFFSSHSVAATWAIRDMSMRLERMK